MKNIEKIDDMVAVILCGGRGTRIAEESDNKPKPMIEIGKDPLIIHIMKYYAMYNVRKFILCVGYKQEIVKQYFGVEKEVEGDVSIYWAPENTCTKWEITIADTGLMTETAGRLKRVQKYLGESSFFLTYGDGVSNVNLNELLKCHYKAKKIVTISTYLLKSRFGVVSVYEDGEVKTFEEKKEKNNELINIGYMVCQPTVFDYIEDDSTSMERYVLNTLVREHQVQAYFHSGFWHCMDSYCEKLELEKIWSKGNAPWKVW